MKARAIQKEAHAIKKAGTPVDEEDEEVVLDSRPYILLTFVNTLP